MEYIKLQIGCLAVILITIAIYLQQARHITVKCSKSFDSLCYVFPWFIVFDGLTAWTVNNPQIVPEKINLLLHLIFYIVAVTTLLCSFYYMLNKTVGIPKNKLLLALVNVPFVITVIVMLMTFPKVQFVQGKDVTYSMGVSPIACFAGTLFYFGSIMIVTIINRKEIEHRNRMAVGISFVTCFTILLAQIIFPEILITSLFPTLLFICFYIIFEHPASRRLNALYNEMISAFSNIVENRDNNTGGHIKRTKLYVQLILSEMKERGIYKDELTKDFVTNMENAAPMHDIGKIGTPDAILQKPGKLTDEEFAIMKQHAPNGGKIILDTFKNLNDKEFLELAYDVARYHHEKWNGRGYPEGLSGENIPLSARIMAVADVFDAVSAKRVYRDAMPIEKCFEIIQSGVGTDFDPQIATVFLENKEQVLEVYNREKDSE